MMTTEEIAYLRSTPECVDIEFAGKVRPWLLCDEAFSLAENAGVTMTELMGARLSQAQADLREVREGLEGDGVEADALALAGRLPIHILTRFAALRLWAGFAVFGTEEDPAPSLEFVRAVVNARNYADFLRQMNAPYADLAGGDGAEGKAEAVETPPSP
jgi:hypothetical protein